MMNHEDNTITPADMLRGMQIALIQKYGTLEKIYSTPAKDIQAAYEKAHYMHYGRLPDDARIIGEVLMVDGVNIFVDVDVQ